MPFRRGRGGTSRAGPSMTAARSQEEEPSRGGGEKEGNYGRWKVDMEEGTGGKGDRGGGGRRAE
eukprot:746434-Hanusia_phi.AAC.2